MKFWLSAPEIILKTILTIIEQQDGMFQLACTLKASQEKKFLKQYVPGDVLVSLEVFIREFTDLDVSGDTRFGRG